MTEITFEEWVAEIDSAANPSKDALGVGGWAIRLGRRRAAVSAWIREGLQRGWMERAVMEIEELTGRRRRAVGFRLIENATKRRKGTK